MSRNFLLLQGLLWLLVVGAALGPTGTPRSDAGGRAGAADSPLAEDLWNLKSVNVAAARESARAWREAADPDVTPAAASPIPDVIVAVIDTGVDYRHPDIAPYAWENKDDPKFRHGCHFYEAGGGVQDEQVIPERNPDNVQVVHGTHCAGIVAAMLRQGGVRGRSVQILPLRTHGPEDIGRAIYYALKQQKRLQEKKQAPVRLVLSLSVAYFATASGNRPRRIDFPSTDLEQAVSAATKADNVLVVCAAGNTPDGDKGAENLKNLDEKANFCIPACYGRAYKYAPDLALAEPEAYPVNPRRMIVVASADREGKLSDFSCYGGLTADLAAPGGQGEFALGKLDPDGNLAQLDPDKEVLSAIPTDNGLLNTAEWKPKRWQPGHDRYASLYGTSQAAPHVAAAAALLWMHPKYRTATAEQVKELLVAPDHVRPLPGLAGKCQSGGMLDLNFLLKELPAQEAGGFEAGAVESPEARRAFAEGRHLFWRGRYQEALEEFEVARALLPGDPARYYFLAFTQARLGNRELASRYLAAALRLERRKPIKGWGLLVERLQGPERDRLEHIRDAYLQGKVDERLEGDGRTFLVSLRDASRNGEPAPLDGRTWTDWLTSWSDGSGVARGQPIPLPLTRPVQRPR
jgi:subtilisin family serine protease